MDGEAALLFTPTKPVRSTSPSTLTEPESNTTSYHTPEPQSRPFAILPPPLASVERRTYTNLTPGFMSRGIELPVDEIVGEWSEKGVDYFYARYDGGILQRVRDALL